MLRKVSTRFSVALAVLLLGGAVVWAQGDEAVIGTWEGLSEEGGEFVFVEFSDDGALAMEVYDVEFGSYQVDEEQSRFAWWDAHDDEEDEPEWIGYELDGDRLTVMEGEMQIPLTRVWTPKKPANPLAGRWEMLMDEIEGLEELKEKGEDIPGAFIVEMGNDGTAMAMELEEVVAGTYSCDAETGTLQSTVEGETRTGSYEIDGDRMVVVVDEKELVFERVE